MVTSSITIQTRFINPTTGVVDYNKKPDQHTEHTFFCSCIPSRWILMWSVCKLLQQDRFPLENCRPGWNFNHSGVILGISHNKSNAKLPSICHYTPSRNENPVWWKNRKMHGSNAIGMNASCIFLSQAAVLDKGRSTNSSGWFFYPSGPFG